MGIVGLIEFGWGVMSIASFTLARLTEVQQEAPAYGFNSTVERPGGQAAA